MTKGPLNIIKNAKCNTAPTDTIANDINPSVIHSDGEAAAAKRAVEAAGITERTLPAPARPSPALAQSFPGLSVEPCTCTGRQGGTCVPLGSFSMSRDSKINSMKKQIQ